MTGTPGCREIRQALGVYVLGAIDPAERAQVDEHLSVCHECREELASLAGLPAMLRKVPVAEAERLAAPDWDSDAAETPSPAMIDSLLSRTVNVRRLHRWRRLAAAAAVVVVALGGGAAVATVLQPSAPKPAVVAWHQTVSAGSAASAHLTVRYRHEQWGTDMLVRVSGLKPGSVCKFEVTDSHGSHWVAGGWVQDSWKGSVWYPGSTWLGERDLRGFEVTVGGAVVASAPAT